MTPPLHVHFYKDELGPGARAFPRGEGVVVFLSSTLPEVLTNLREGLAPGRCKDRGRLTPSMS